MLKVNNRNPRKWCEICSKLTIKTPERRQWCRSGVFIVKFEHISHLFLVLLLLTLKQVNVRWQVLSWTSPIVTAFKRYFHCLSTLLNYHEHCYMYKSIDEDNVTRFPFINALETSYQGPLRTSEIRHWTETG